MLTHRTANPRGRYQSIRTPLLSGAAGAALAAGAVLGIQHIQQAQRAHGSSAASVHQIQSPARVSGRAGPAGDPRTAAVAVSRPNGDPTTYIVRTPAEEQAFLGWVVQGDFAVPAGAEPGASVVLAPSPDEAAFARAALQQQAEEASRGITASTVGTAQQTAALNRSTGNTSGTAAALTRSRSTTTVYLAHSEEQAQTLRDWIAAGDFGVPAGAPADAAVIVAPAPDEAAFARAAVMQWLGESGATPEVVDAWTIQ